MKFNVLRWKRIWDSDNNYEDVYEPFIEDAEIQVLGHTDSRLLRINEIEYHSVYSVEIHKDGLYLKGFRYDDKNVLEAYDFKMVQK